eukprot:gene172-1695_t
MVLGCFLGPRPQESVKDAVLLAKKELVPTISPLADEQSNSRINIPLPDPLIGAAIPVPSNPITALRDSLLPNNPSNLDVDLFQSQGASSTPPMSRLADFAASPELVRFCSPEDLLQDITGLSYVGCGFFAKLFKGSWQSSKVAVKCVALPSDGLEPANAHRWSEVMAKDLAHPNLVQTFMARCARVDGEYYKKVHSEPAANAGGLSEGHNTFVSGGERLLLLPVSLETDTKAIVKLLSVPVDGIICVIIMDFVDGGPLLSALAKGIFLPRGDAAGNRHKYRGLLRTICDIARGLEYLHSRDIIHGDLKPPNICDFGLSRLVEGSQAVDMTAPKGSFAYMAPEVLQSCTSKAADVYALGIMIWEMQFGERPYQGMTVPEVLRGVLHGTLRPVWRPLPYGDNHPELAELYIRCVQQGRDSRPTATEVVQELSNIEDRLRKQMSPIPGTAPDTL